MKLWNRRNFLKASILSPFLVRLGLGQITSIAPQSSPIKTESAQSNSPDLSLLLHCIAEVETGNDDSKIGPKGERSRYQISRTVWEQHYEAYTFDKFCKGCFAKGVAHEHLLWLDRHIPHITPIERDFREYALTWCWHGGLSTWNRAYDINLNNYAVRVTNLYDDPQFRLAFRKR
jgi:hypothetical protein